MSTVLVPAEVKEMNRRIDQILEILRTQNSMICQLLPQSAKMRADLKGLASLESKLDAIDDSIFSLKSWSDSRER